MTLREQLTPVSFHLRNFNKYVKLDLNAAKNGNLTLIGENAAGKTTLANCFFPMLVDGSIATPSFNAAKGTDHLDKSVNPHSSKRDSRNFESMLLGWGPGAMKVRTGYSYIDFRSAKRQVILGLGAHRVVGEQRKPTWWFVVINPQPTAPIQLVTTDQDGKSLEEDDFAAANKGLGDQLHIFKQAVHYREYVATQVYGFTGGADLAKLASVYKLLASPILTAGNARFTPIREALKNAQEGIDPDMIGQVAESQRDVNQTNGMLQRIKRAQERLDKIKKDVFWRNLNHIRENILDPYSQVTQDSEAKKEQIDQAQQVIGTVEEQLQLITDNLKASTQNLESLRQEKANQEGLIQRRKDYQQQINSLTQRLATYRSQLKQLQGLKDELTKITRSQADCQQQSQEIREHSIQPLLTELAAAAKDRPELTTVVTEVENAKLNQDLGDYLRQMKSAVTKYQNDERAKERVGQDIKIVSDMRTTLDTRIDKRAAGPLQGRVRHDLHQDNLEVHEAGAAKMGTQFEQLLLKQQELLAKHPDLKGILSLPDFILHLTKLRESLTENLRQLERLDQQVKQLLTQQNFCERQIAAVDIEQNFDEQRVTSDIDKLQERHDQLVVDTEIDVKIEQAEKDYQKFLTEQQNLGAKRAKAEERIANSQSEIKRFAEKLAQLDAAGLQVLQLLAPYHPENVQLDTVIAAIDFVQNNRSQVRNSSYGETGDRLARLIHDNGSNGIDRNALDTIFEERGYSDIASAMRQHRTINRNDVIMVNFDINRAQLLMATDENHVAKKLTELQLGNNVALDTYLTAAVQRITAQYKLITDYNRMLLEGVSREQSIKLKIELTPSEVADEVIDEACNPKLTDRPVLTAEIQNRLEKLATDLSIADDEELFMAAAQKLLDTRQWSAFKVLIKRRQSAEDNYEEVDDKFVQSGGSGAEKAQAMVLPLLLVPKMVLRQATLQDAPYLVMFDEFADKLDPETAKSFAKTISRFGFNFIATMPSGAQNKILADRVDNIAYDVIAPRNQNDGRFHENIINEALTWGDAHE